jgi:hypothetical protein
MPIEIPAGDLANATTHEPDLSFPSEIQLRLVWKKDGRAFVRTMRITADEFFGRGGIGAPISGDAIVQHIERMRKKGAPNAKR